MKPRRVTLGEQDIPAAYYNILADLPRPLDPPLHPGTAKPIGPDDLAPIFPLALIEQEVSRERYIEIPAERRAYATYRPTPLVRAYDLERKLDTPAEITSSTKASAPPGVTSPTRRFRRRSTTSKAGIRRLATETGRRTVGRSALSLACNMFGLECKVYMVRRQLRPEAVPALHD